GSAPGNLRTGQQLGGKVDGVVRHRSAPPTTPGQTPASGTQPNSCEKRNGKNGTSNRAGSPPAPPPAANRVALELVFRRILRSPFAPANLHRSAQPRPPPAPRHTTAAGTVPSSTGSRRKCKPPCPAGAASSNNTIMRKDPGRMPPATR